jgi:hypothetical protein
VTAANAEGWGIGGEDACEPDDAAQLPKGAAVVLCWIDGVGMHLHINPAHDPARVLGLLTLALDGFKGSLRAQTSAALRQMAAAAASAELDARGGGYV